MDPVLFGQILMMAIILLLTVVISSLAFNIGCAIDGTGAFQAMVGYALWLVNFCFMCGILGHFEWFDGVLYAGMTWPYVIAFFFALIPPLSHTRISGPLAVILLAIFLTKVFWMTR